MIENTESIAGWNANTFGRLPSPLNAAKRARQELDELIEKLEELEDMNNSNPQTSAIVDRIARLKYDARLECADVTICLHVTSRTLSGDLETDVDNKMAINHTRGWHSNGDGTGRHITKSPLEL